MADNTFDILASIVSQVRCKPGWNFRLQDEDGALRLVITIAGFDSYDETKHMRVAHFFPVPTATYNEKSWRRWIFEMCRGVENHELGEWFRVGKEERPFAPLHGPGENPYTIHEFRDEVDARTLQDGSITDTPIVRPREKKPLSPIPPPLHCPRSPHRSLDEGDICPECGTIG